MAAAVLHFAAAGLLTPAPIVVPALRASRARFAPLCMNEEDEGLTEWEKYQQKRGMASFDQAQDDYKTVRRTHAFAARAECGSPPVLQPDPSPPHPREPCAHQPMIPRAVQDAHPCRRQ